MKYNDVYDSCPYATSQRLLAGIWSMYILYTLSKEAPIRFNELQRKMPVDMTHTTLSRQLKQLEQEGLIQRVEYSQIPPKVEYSLTDIGKKFEKVLDALGEWGKEYIAYQKQKES